MHHSLPLPTSARRSANRSNLPRKAVLQKPLQGHLPAPPHPTAQRVQIQPWGAAAGGGCLPTLLPTPCTNTRHGIRVFQALLEGGGPECWFTVEERAEALGWKKTKKPCETSSRSRRSANPALCLTKANKREITEGRGSTEKPPGHGSVRLQEAQGWRAVGGTTMPAREMKSPLPLTGTGVRQSFLLKLEGKVPWGEPLADGWGWSWAAGSCWPLRWPRWRPLPPFPRMERPPEGACSARHKFARWFPSDGSKFFYCSLSWIFHGQFSWETIFPRISSLPGQDQDKFEAAPRNKTSSAWVGKTNNLGIDVKRDLMGEVGSSVGFQHKLADRKAGGGSGGDSRERGSGTKEPLWVSIFICLRVCIRECVLNI